MVTPDQFRWAEALPLKQPHGDAAPYFVAERIGALLLPNAILGPGFVHEAAAALPVEHACTFDGICTALEWRRLGLRQDQQAPEWTRLRDSISSPSVTTTAPPP